MHDLSVEVISYAAMQAALQKGWDGKSSLELLVVVPRHVFFVYAENRFLTAVCFA